MSAPYGSDIASVAALLADRTRASILTALLDGRPLAAGELARTAGVGAATASSHLTKLLDGGLVSVVRQGRHRYYRLRSEEVAGVIEAVGRISPDIEVRSLRQSQEVAALREARTCYDHLAGRAGAALFEALLSRGLLEPLDVSYGEPACAAYDVTAAGEERLRMLDIDVGALRLSRRRFAGHCLDWTERRPHLNGALGAAITAGLIERGWFERGSRRRALVLTGVGRAGLAEAFGCVLSARLTSNRIPAEM